MPCCIVETDDGWVVVEHPAKMTAEEAAQRHGAALIDPGPYQTSEEAYEALEGLQRELLDEDGAAELAPERVLEGRGELRD